MLKCPICKKRMVESNYQVVFEEGIFYQEYFCFNCYKLFECSSQSGDMIEEYLDLKGDVEEIKCSNKVIECKEDLIECPLCGSELAYEISHDFVDLYMYCKSDKCNFIGIKKDVYLDKDSLYYEE